MLTPVELKFKKITYTHTYIHIPIHIYGTQIHLIRELEIEITIRYHLLLPNQKIKKPGCPT